LELDYFTAILQKAQRVAANAEREKLNKCPKTYKGMSKRTLKQCKKCREDLAKKGYLSVFDFMAHMKGKAKKRAHMAQLMERAAECGKQASEESMAESDQALENSAAENDSEQVSKSDLSEDSALDTEVWVSRCTMGQVHHMKLLMH
jgi:hypothetical protein